MDSHELLDYVKKKELRLKNQLITDFQISPVTVLCLSLKRTHKLVGSQARVQPFKQTAIEYK